ncbi:calcineurin-binding protein [Kwoniella mangroviensis CBS 10435]|uniref:Calcineurin-binding protein n=1 Tax=Kwoniella mangroviensis CBS 10435 TaxID=1331196 RepID=A0A1B9ISF9_9TREE|nr:calcineurin-binding protein [Kwoniella mangroviensis CBS 8507]OCF58466.1 calcineurin-binding protein [Kwoniella mangroviensis CBS 10435]OCF64120.1 calcineurin-binding protein [Kwoniella mangroviensis CBS 8507]OCF78474.1 calcineurin-binding protein [Kwoniella mangroviensis CBS 8886]
MTSSPGSISIPPPPPLDPPEEPTNTLALLLPNQALFSPPILALLKDHYGLFGDIVHWAPVKGFGRAIVVFATNEDAERAKKEGDWLKLDLTSSPSAETGAGGDEQEGQQRQRNQVEKEEMAQDKREDGYFTPKDTNKRRSKRQSDVLKANELILRLHYLPPTPLNPDPASFHLAPPSIPHNFLISPPGSPPEGWEQIAEEGPNTSILAEDLQRALEALALNGAGGRQKGGKEVILDEGGVRVEVEDTTKQSDADEGVDERWEMDVEERLDISTSHDIWNSPSQSNFATTVGGPSGLGGLGGLSGSGTPMGKVKIAPTARPPM